MSTLRSAPRSTSSSFPAASAARRADAARRRAPSSTRCSRRRRRPRHRARSSGWTRRSAEKRGRARRLAQQQLARGRLADDTRLSRTRRAGLPADALAASTVTRGEGARPRGCLARSTIPGVRRHLAPSARASRVRPLALSAEDDGLSSSADRSTGRQWRHAAYTADARSTRPRRRARGALDSGRSRSTSVRDAAQREPALRSSSSRRCSASRLASEVVQLFEGETAWSTSARAAARSRRSRSPCTVDDAAAGARRRSSRSRALVAKRTDATQSTPAPVQRCTRLRTRTVSTVTLRRASTDSVVVTTAASGIEAFAAAGAKLADDRRRSQQPTERAGMTTARRRGLALRRRQTVMPLLVARKARGGEAAGRRAAMCWPLIDDVFVRTSADGSTLRSTGFVRVP